MASYQQLTQRGKDDAMPSQSEIRQQITQQIIESLQQGIVPWKRPWLVKLVSLCVGICGIRLGYIPDPAADGVRARAARASSIGYTGTLTNCSNLNGSVRGSLCVTVSVMHDVLCLSSRAFTSTTVGS